MPRSFTLKGSVYFRAKWEHFRRCHHDIARGSVCPAPLDSTPIAANMPTLPSSPIAPASAAAEPDGTSVPNCGMTYQVGYLVLWVALGVDDQEVSGVATVMAIADDGSSVSHPPPPSRITEQRLHTRLSQQLDLRKDPDLSNIRIRVYHVISQGHRHPQNIFGQAFIANAEEVFVYTLVDHLMWDKGLAACFYSFPVALQASLVMTYGSEVSTRGTRFANANITDRGSDDQTFLCQILIKRSVKEFLLAARHLKKAKQPYPGTCEGLAGNGKYPLAFQNAQVLAAVCQGGQWGNVRPGMLEAASDFNEALRKAEKAERGGGNQEVVTIDAE